MSKKQFNVNRLLLLVFLLFYSLSTEALWGQTSPHTFTTTGTVQQFTVPAGVTSITMTVKGADGGNATTSGVAGGEGAEAIATFAVMPGDRKYVLEFGSDAVRLLNRETKSQSKIEVDFLSGKAEHRRRFGGGKGQLIAKAVGVTSKFKPMVFDATAGLGQDGFVLACLGCKVDMMERSPVAYALLYDGLSRAKSEPGKDQEVEAIFARLNLLQGDSIEYLKKAKFPVSDIIYLDPMFPSRQKKAAVKKEMQAFHALVGKDSDELELLDVALSKAKFRVVVKRPRLASPIGNRSPSFKCEGKSSRYDVYCLKALGQNDQEG